MYIPIILGTAREGRQSKKAADFILNEVKKAGLETEFIDVRDYRIEATDNTKKSEPAKILSEKFNKADGFIIISPEYNHGYPGELKMMLDMFYSEYARKPVGFCGVSMGILGGARMVEQLRLVSIELHMVPIREAIYFPMIQNLFNEKGNIEDLSYEKKVEVFLEELIWYAKTLKKAREQN